MRLVFIIVLLTAGFDVMGANRAPVIAPIPGQSIQVDQDWSITVKAADLDNNKLAYSLVASVPSGLQINSGSGLITWKPRASQAPSTNTIVVVVTDDGTPRLSATNSFTVVVRTLVVLPSLPGIVQQPKGDTVTEGANITLTVFASGTPPLAYQWKLNRVALPGQTNAILLITRASQGDAGVYQVDISNIAGKVTSDEAIIVVRVPPSITRDPVDQTVLPGANVTIAVSATGAPPLRYQWRYNGQAISGATSNPLVLTNVSQRDEGLYRVEVANDFGAALSREALLTVLRPPQILKQPQDAAAKIGEKVELTVEASGSSPLRYQWYLNDAPLPPATNSVLTLDRIQPNQAGFYRVVVSNAAGEASSAIAEVVVQQSLLIRTQPLSRIARLGDEVQFSVSVLGSGPIQLQWYFHGKPLVGGTNILLTIASAGPENNGVYYVEIKNPISNVKSDQAVLKVFSPPAVVRQSADQTVLAGANVVFGVTVIGTEPLRFQWRYNGKDIPGATDQKLVLNAVQAAQNGSYSVFVTNLAGSATSTPAQLIVNSPIAILRRPESMTVRSGQPASFEVVATGTPPVFYRWFFEGRAIPGATNSILHIPDTEPEDSGTYAVVIGNPANVSVSAGTSLKVIAPVEIEKQPESRTIRMGDDLVLEVEASGTGPFTYQWRRNGTNLLGENNQVLKVSKAGLADAGEYTVTVGNGLSSATSAKAIVTVEAPPALSGLPATQTAVPGQDVTFSAVTQGTGPFSFQWLLNGVRIPGATNSTFTIRAAKSTDSGTYSVVVENRGGATSSQQIDFKVPAPTFTLTDQFAARLSTNLAVATFSGSNIGATSENGEPNHLSDKKARRSVWFSWRAPFSGVVRFSTAGSSFDTILAAYQGSTLSSLTQLASDDDSGPFQSSAIVFNAVAGAGYEIAIDGSERAVGSIVISWVLQAAAGRIPEILSHPRHYTALPGGTVQLGILAQGAGTGLSYQWYLDGVKVPGATLPGLLLTNLSRANVGKYVVEVSDGTPLGTILSQPAVVQITSDPATSGAVIGAEDKLSSTNDVAARAIGSKPIHLLGSVSRGYSGSQIFSTKTAVKDAGEPNHCGIAGGASTWFLYEAATNGVLQLNTDGSDFDTVLAAYTGPGTDYASLVPAGCDNDSGSNGKTSSLAIPVIGGTNYYIVVDGVNGASGIVQLNYSLAQPPVFTQQPLGELLPRSGGAIHAASLVATQAVVAGSNVKLSAAATNALAPVTIGYQWKLNGLTLAGATNAVLILSNITASAEGDYTIAATNVAGTAESLPMRLIVYSPVTILSPPLNQVVPAGGTAVFGVAPAGTLPWAFQWRWNGTLLPGATNDTLTLTNVQSANEGVYSVEVSNVVGVMAASASLTVPTPPAIATQPRSTIAAPDSTVVFTVAASGTGPISYQWRFNGFDIAGAASANLVITNVQLSYAGEYTVVLSNLVRSVTSDAATLDINASNILTAPIITQQPASQAALPGASVQFTVVAAGSDPLSYQWSFNSQPIPGATQSNLVLTNISQTVAGSYAVQVSNSAGLTNSVAAILTLATPPTLSISTGPAGSSVRISINGPAIGVFNLLSTESFAAWTVLTNFTLNGGPFDFSDPVNASRPARFYKVASP